MRDFLKVYKENRKDIEGFIITTLKNSGEISDTDFKRLFDIFPSLEVLYITDKENTQISENIFRDKIDISAKSKNRSYLLAKLQKYDEEIMITEPYISSATGETCITIMKKEDGKNVFMDINIPSVLSRLGLIELHPEFNRFTKMFYKIIGFSLIASAFFAVIYAFIGYIKIFMFQAAFSIDSLFKPIVALTLGLAIFDLSKTILEREVFFKEYKKTTNDSNLLTKFSIAIIIALSIEALMVVFKIALHDYTQMIYAFYLISGISFIIISLGIYRK